MRMVKWGTNGDWRINPPAFASVHRPIFGNAAYRPLPGSGRYRGRGWGSVPQKASWASAQIHVFVIRDISRTTEQTGERDPLIVEPCTRSDVCLRHVSCGARAASSLTRIINNVRQIHARNTVLFLNPCHFHGSLRLRAELRD